MAKSQKIPKLKLGKYDEDCVFFRKQRFHFLKRFFLQKWEGKKYAKVAGRFVLFLLRISFAFT